MSLRKLKWRGIGRLELLAWLNEFLETDYTKIEHLADGIGYCQIFDALYPGKVNLQQLNFNARTETEYERNFRVLRRAFQLCDVRKEIPVRKLVQGIFQEHFEFLHWIHDYVHRTCPDAVRSYRGFDRRQEILAQSLSQSPMNAPNTNLIPKYSNSIKTSQSVYIEGYVLEAYEGGGDEAITSVGEPTTTKIVEEDQTVTTNSDDDEEFDGMDPEMQIVRHSFRSTLRAKLALTGLDNCMETTSLAPPKANKASKKEASRGSKSRLDTNSGGRRSKPKPALVFEDPNEPDPMMCRCISELLECLESELLGRVKDLQFLEKNVETLVAQPSRQKQAMTSGGT